MLQATTFLALPMVMFGFAAHASVLDIDANLPLSEPLQVFLTAGTYLVEPIGPDAGGAYTAWNPWITDPSCSDSDGCSQCSGSQGWSHRLRLTSPLIASAIVGDAVVPPTPIPGCDSVDFLSFVGGTWRLQVQDGRVYPTPQDALAHARSIIVELSGDGFVGFSVGDIDTGNNTGGMSVRLSQPVSVDGMSFGRVKTLYR